MTIKEAILKSLEDLRKLATHNDIYEHIIKSKYYQFNGDAPKNQVSSRLGSFIRKNDQRVKRIKNKHIKRDIYTNFSVVILKIKIYMRKQFYMKNQKTQKMTIKSGYILI
jgi:hypothetical protein